jgi:hypothetical protein
LFIAAIAAAVVVSKEILLGGTRPNPAVSTRGGQEKETTE